MKKLTFIYAIAITIGLFLTGCAGSGESKPYTPTELQVDVDAAVGSFAAFQLSSRPAGRPAWERAASGLQNLADNQNWSVPAFTEAFAVSGASVIENQRIQLVVENGLVVVNALSRGRVNMSDPQYARAVIEGALSAIKRVLKSTTPKPVSQVSEIRFAQDNTIDCVYRFNSVTGEYISPLTYKNWDRIVSEAK